MAQFARPSSDITVNSWTTTPLYEQIDEATYSDTDFIERNAVSYCEVALSSLSDPSSSSDHVVRYRYGRDTTSRTITLVVRLYQGSTEIASWTHTNPSLSFVLAEQTLTGTQADAITDYTDLRLRFDITAIQNNQVYGQVSWAELEVPDAAINTKASVPSYTRGKQNATGSQIAYLTGCTNTKGSIPVYVSSEPDIERSSTSVYLAGKNQTHSATLAFLRGCLNTLDSLPVYLSGHSFIRGSISSYTEGTYGISTAISAYLAGTSSSPITTIIKIAFVAPTSMAADAKSSTSVFLYSVAIELHSISAYMSGKLDTKTSKHAHVVVGLMTNTSIQAYLYGVRVRAHSISAYLEGLPFISSSQKAFTLGNVGVNSLVHAFIVSLLCESSHSISAYLAGVERSSTHCFLAGVIERVDFIQLKTSDNGATLSKRFLVLQQDYDDGTKETTEDVRKTISGGTQIAVGRVYTTWNMIIRVPVETNDERYGTFTDLTYLYSLNNPNGTPSNIITFIDHRGYEHKVMILGKPRQNILTTAVEGVDAVFLYRLQLIGV